MMFIPVPAKVIYTQGKEYCPITLPSFIQKTKQKLLTRNINNKTLGQWPYIYNNLPTKHRSQQISQCIMWLDTYMEQQKTGSCTWMFLDIEAASDSTSCDIRNAAHGMQFETNFSNGLATSWVAQKSQPHLQEKHWKCLWSSAVNRGAFYYPKLWKLFAVELIEALWNGCYTLRYTLFSSVGNNQTVYHSVYRRFWERNNCGVEKPNYQSNHRRFSTLSISYKTRPLTRNLLAGHWNFFQSRGQLNAWKKDWILSMCMGHYCAQSSCILFYSVQIYRVIQE
jgi:hypothetical protein